MSLFWNFLIVFSAVTEGDVVDVWCGRFGCKRYRAGCVDSWARVLDRSQVRGKPLTQQSALGILRSPFTNEERKREIGEST